MKFELVPCIYEDTKCVHIECLHEHKSRNPKDYRFFDDEGRITCDVYLNYGIIQEKSVIYDCLCSYVGGHE